MTNAEKLANAKATLFAVLHPQESVRRHYSGVNVDVRARALDSAGWLIERVRALEAVVAVLAHGLDNWKFTVSSKRDIGRMNYDTGITVGDVMKARELLGRPPAGPPVDALEARLRLAEQVLEEARALARTHAGFDFDGLRVKLAAYDGEKP